VFTTEFGPFILHAYEFDDGSEHAALATTGEVTMTAPLVRLQSSCLTGTAFHALLCDCRQQLLLALERIGREGGCVIYLDQEGRGHGLVEKVSQLDEIARGANTYEAALNRRVEPDVRHFAGASYILRQLYGNTAVRMLTNNPDKILRAEASGIVVGEREPCEPDPTPTNRSYLEAKKVFMGHLLAKV
jgi:3,4-dihydroxy 2-butanone 4-phosphate synthase/GTP cyclohydrolase II